MPTHYDLLGIARNSTPDEIRRAYIKQAFESHPDRNNGDSTKTELFIKIKAAYEILNDPIKRAEYDSTLPGSRQTPWRDVFSSVDVKAGRKSPTYHRPGQDVEHEIVITFAESFFGCTRDIAYQIADTCPLCDGNKHDPEAPKVKCGNCGGSGMRYDFIKKIVAPCFACEGRGKIAVLLCTLCNGVGTINKPAENTVSIPASIRDGSQVRYPGLGNPGLPPGDLMVKVRVSSLDDVQRVGNDIIFNAMVPMLMMIEGGTLSVPTPTNVKLDLEIFPNSRAGSLTVVKNRGFVDPKTGESGNLRVRLIPTIPQRLTAAQIADLRALVVGND